MRTGNRNREPRLGEQPKEPGCVSLSLLMSRIADRSFRQALWAGPLLALLIAALFLEGVPVIHAHVDGEPGFYNEVCSLSFLAAPSAGALLPSTDLPGPHLPALPAPIQTAAPSPPSPLLLGAVSRAPPAV